MTYLLAMEQGTSSCRSIVFDPSGQTLAMAQKELPQIYPQPGRVEHDALEIWRLQLATAREVLTRAGISACQVTALAITCLVRPRNDDRRCRRRPAKRLVRPGLLQRWHGQKHLWHGLLYADAHWERFPDLGQWPDHHQRRAGHGKAGIVYRSTA